MRLIALPLAISSLRRNKTRTVLTILGIVIGIAAVITVMSVSAGFKAFVVGQVETFGTDAIQVEIKVPNTGKNSSDNATGIAQGIQITSLTLDDVEALRNLPGVKNNYATIIGQKLAAYESNNVQVLLWGTTASFIEIDSTEVEVGRFFTDEEDRNLSQVIVLGSGIKEDLFGEKEAVGKSVQLGNQKYTVIGVMESRGSIAFFDMDSFAYVPVRTLQKRILGVDHVTMVFNQVSDTSKMDQIAEDITFTLRDRHDITDPDKDDFSVTTMTEALEIYDAIFGAINLLLVSIAGISLLVGGVGIMNIMYVSVSERTYEIGLRKSMGARRKNILSQFLIEAIIVTFLGGVIGLILGIGFSYLIALAASSQGVSIAFVVSMESIFIACGVSLVIGLVFGVFPALAAAKLDPVTALRRK
jgi:putative ABC transport system permease protein